TTRQAAAHCRVSIPTLRRWIRAGELGAHLTPGGHRRIDLGEFQRFLRAQGRPAYPVGPERRTRVLLVDDEPLVVQMLHDLLIDGPFAIETATDGYEPRVGRRGPSPATACRAHHRSPLPHGTRGLKEAMDSIRVLYVEGDPTDQELTHRHLVRHAPHIKLTVVGTVAEAVERVTIGDM